MRQPTPSIQCNSINIFNNNKTKQKSKTNRQTFIKNTPINPVVVTVTTKNDTDVDNSCIVNTTNAKEEDLRMVMEMNSVNGNQS